MGLIFNLDESDRVAEDKTNSISLKYVALFNILEA